MEVQYDAIRISNSVVRNGINFRPTDGYVKIQSEDTDGLTIGANRPAGKIDINCGTGGFIVDATKGGGSSGSVAGPFTIKGKADSLVNVTDANLTLSTTNSGDVKLSTTTDGDIVLSSSDNIYQNATNNITHSSSSGNIDLKAHTGALNLSSKANSLFTVDSGDLNLTTTTSGNMTFDTVGSLNIEADTSATINVDTGGLNLKTTTSGDVTVSTTTDGDIVLSSADNMTNTAANNITQTSTAGTFALTAAAGALNLSSNANSLYTVDSGDLNLTTTTSGNMTLDTVGSLNIEADDSATINVDTGGLNLKTTTSGDVTVSTTTNGDIVLSSADNMTNTAAGNITQTANTGTMSLTAASGPLNLSSNANSLYTVDSGDLRLTTTTSGDMILDTVGSLSIEADNSATINVDTGGLILKTTTSGDVTVSTTTDGDIVLSSADNIVNTAANNITQTATSGTFSLTAASGPLNLSSNENSLYTVDSGDLNLSTTTSGNYSVTSAGTITEDAVGEIFIGNSNATGVTIGRSGTVTTIGGDLIVNGTTTSVNSTTAVIGDNILVLNSIGGEPGSSGYDAGILIDRTATDVTSDSEPVITGNTSVAVTSGNYQTNKLQLQSGDSTSVANMHIKITSGPLSGQARQISSVSAEVVTTSTDWSPVNLTGESFKVTNSGTKLKASGSGDDSPIFETELSPGMSILIGSEYYVVESITNDKKAVLNGENTNDVGDQSSCQIVGPGSVTYNTYQRSLVGMIYDESCDQFSFMSTLTDPGSAAVRIQDYVDLKVDNMYSSSLTVSDSTVAAHDGSNFTAGSIVSSGGLGVNSNVFVHSDGGGVPVITAQQISTTGAQPTLYMKQNDVDESFVKFEGESGASGSTTNSIINSNSAISIGVAGFIKCQITDNGTDHPVTDGTYYLPFYSIS